MQPEDRLDALLTVLREPNAASPASSSAGRLPADAELAPLVRAAREVSVLSRAVPDPAYASDLRLSVLARASAMRQDAAQRVVPMPPGRTAPSIRSRTPLWAGLAAAVLLAATVGAATAAAHAGPSSPLFGLHRFEQSIQVAAANDSSSRVRLHIQYARQWLGALTQTAQQDHSGDAFQSALAVMLQEDTSAQSELAHVTDHTAQSDLSQALAALLSDERSELHAALQQVGWSDRVSATLALGQLGESVPVVSQLQATNQHGDIQVVITGSGFEPGARLVLDGHPIGDVTASSATSLTVLLSRDSLPEHESAVGVSNPDGTAAQTTQDSLDKLLGPARDATWSPGTDGQPTPASGDHTGGESTPSPGVHGPPGEGTPTPQTTHTPDQ